MRCALIGGVILFGVIALFSPVVKAQEFAVPEGPSDRLTQQGRDRAVECGRIGPECAITPYELCGSESGPFTVRMVTPFSRVAEAVVEAEAGRKPLGRMGPAAVNRWGIGLSVYPAQGSVAADSIRQVFIRKDGQLVQPIGATVGPITRQASDGTTQSMTRGFFAFTASAFDGSSAVTIILVGSAGETSCTLDRARLGTLR